MLSYPVSEAEDLLDEKLEAARKALAGCEEDLEFLREQVTVRSLSFLQINSFRGSGSGRMGFLPRIRGREKCGREAGWRRGVVSMSFLWSLADFYV